eukprot:gene6006-4311_t
MILLPIQFPPPPPSSLWYSSALSSISHSNRFFIYLTFLMSSRQGGKQKPLKAPKKDRRELDDDDIAFQQKLKDQKKAEKDLPDIVQTKPPNSPPQCPCKINKLIRKLHIHREHRFYVIMIPNINTSFYFNSYLSRLIGSYSHNRLADYRCSDS